MTDERLIAEARRPMTDMDITQDPAATRAFIRRLANALEDAEKRAETEHYAKNRARNQRNEAREALAVFEKAHTPTDDEREVHYLCDTCGEYAPCSCSPHSETPDANAGEGWFEWFKMPENTTEIAYVHANGEVFDPIRGWNPVEFTIAAAEGRVHRLVRAASEVGGEGQ